MSLKAIEDYRNTDRPITPKGKEKIGFKLAQLLPNDSSYATIKGPVVIDGDSFLSYVRGQRELALWVKIYYCDISGRRHWTQVAASHKYRADGFTIIRSEASPGPGEEGHPDCQNYVSD